MQGAISDRWAMLRSGLDREKETITGSSGQRTACSEAQRWGGVSIRGIEREIGIQQDKGKEVGRG